MPRFLISHQALVNVWYAFLIFWLLMALRNKRDARRQSLAGRSVHNILCAVAFFLVFFDAGQRWMDLQVVPHTQAWRAAGTLIAYAGFAIAIWARFALGTNWSGTVTVKQGHQLVRSGPYRVVRHPIYSGILLAGLGTAVQTAQLRAFVGVALAAFAWWLKSRAEERFMVEEFGAEYEQYRRETRALVPFFPFR